MRSYLSILTARLGRAISIRWLLRLPESSGASPIRVLGGALSLVISCYVAYVVHVGPAFQPQFLPSPVAQITKPVCGKQTIQMEDGSTIRLNADACITPEISPKKRLIKLASGEAIFKVAHDPSRPFVVKTGPIFIEALGTEFDVYRRELSTRVVVAEGAVQISSHEASRPNIRPLTDLQQLEVPDDTAQPRVRRDITSSDVDRITAWFHGDIILQSQTLREALIEFARYEHFTVEYQDPQIAEVRFSGIFRVRGIDDFLDLLKTQCIHSEYVKADKAAQRITLTTDPGKRAGDVCK